jgi:tetratricopeptide (TPR) repeat protein
MELTALYTSAMRNGDFTEVDRIGMEVLNHAMATILEDAEQGQVPESFRLHMEASECEQRSDWDAAITAYRREVERAKSSSSPFAQWKPHDDLAQLYYLLGDDESALKEQQLATAAARLDDLNIGLRMALSAEATMLLRLERFAEAESRVREGLAVPNTSEPIDDLGPARLLVLHAGCEAGFGRVYESRQILREVYPVISLAERMPRAAGYHSALLSWWWVEADCCELEDNTAGEIQALEQSLAIARHIDSLPHCADVYTMAKVMRVLDRLAKALWRANNFDDASRFRRESEDIRVALKLPCVR